jgi:hypothetical protein
MLSLEFVQGVLAGIEGTLAELIAGISGATVSARLDLLAGMVADVRESIWGEQEPNTAFTVHPSAAPPLRSRTDEPKEPLSSE